MSNDVLISELSVRQLETRIRILFNLLINKVKRGNLDIDLFVDYLEGMVSYDLDIYIYYNVTVTDTNKQSTELEDTIIEYFYDTYSWECSYLVRLCIDDDEENDKLIPVDKDLIESIREAGGLTEPIRLKYLPNVYKDYSPQDEYDFMNMYISLITLIAIEHIALHLPHLRGGG